MGPGACARAYFEAVERGERDAQRRFYADDAEINVRGAMPSGGKAEIVALFDELWAAIPDFRFEIVDFFSEGDQAVVRWKGKGTFAGPGMFQGLRPNGAALAMEGVDVVCMRDGLLVRNDAYTDSGELARQLGALPPEGSAAENAMKRALNTRSSIARRLVGDQVDEVADGVWRLQGEPGRCNVYFVHDGDGVLMFDAGARAMVSAVRAASARLGGLTRIILGHAHTDHRGTAPALGVPVYCHADEVQDAEGSGGWRYWDAKLRDVPAPHRWIQRVLHPLVWDGGPVQVAGTVSEGDEIAGFSVVELPGHAPGQIALYRAADGLALTSDVFYTLDFWSRDAAPHVPADAYNYDGAQARRAVEKLAALELSAAWPGHAEPITGDVAAQLRAAASM